MTSAFRHIDYRIADVRFRVETGHDRLYERLEQWLSDYAQPSGVETEPDLVLTLHVFERDEPLPYRLPAGAVELFESYDIRYYEDGRLWIIAYPDGAYMTVDREAGRLTGYACADELLRSARTFEIFLHPLYELFRRRGLYPFHAASVALNGCGILLLGRSGRGKSTLSADLTANGFDFLADDRCFVRERGDAYTLYAHYEPFKLFAQNVSHIAPLGESQEMTEARAAKRGLDIRRYYPGQSRLTAELSRIIFPYWTPGETSRIEPMAPGKAMIETLPLTLVCFEPAAGQAQFEFLGRLLQSVPAYRLILGDDRPQWHRLVLDCLGR